MIKLDGVKVGKNVIIHGKVQIGKGTVIQDNVIIGNSEEGTVVIGKDSIIRSGSIIYSNVNAGDQLKTGHNILIRENTDIGSDVLIGTKSIIDGNCKIGNQVSIQSGVYITAYTTIRDEVFMGPFSVTTNDKYMRYRDGAELKGPMIDKKARIGANSTILPGIKIGKNAVIGSGAVVTKDVEKNDVVVGNPARSTMGMKKIVK